MLGNHQCHQLCQLSTPFLSRNNTNEYIYIIGKVLTDLYYVYNNTKIGKKLK